MDIFIKAIIGILITVILGLTLSKQGKDISLVLSLCVCAMIALAAMHYFKPLVEFVQRIVTVAQLNSQMLSILLKAVGIGVLSEIVSLICTDAGNTALAKGLQILSSAVILWISIPLLTELLELIEGILGDV